MVETIFHQLTGFAQFSVSGDSARFLNLAAKSGFGFWNFRRMENGAAVCCHAGEYRKLRPLARRCHVRLRCLKKGGVPFYAQRLWLRKGLLAGAVCGVGVFLALSGSVWNVTVTGTERCGDGPVLAAARTAGVYPGAQKNSFDPKVAGRKIIGEMENLKWAAVNTDGCFVEIAVGESAETPEVADDSVWSNMVASQAGTVLSVEASRGRPEVKRGDAVEEGDLLISGLYEEQLEPWDIGADHPMQTAGAARGRVIAETYREFTVQVSAVKREQTAVGKAQVNRALQIFGVRIPLGLNTVPEGNTRFSRQDLAAAALGVTLPLSLERDVYEFVEETERILSRKELEQAALLKLRELQRESVAAGGKVLKEELSYSFPDGMCILTAKCKCQENIGVVREILVK